MHTFTRDSPSCWSVHTSAKRIKAPALSRACGEHSLGNSKYSERQGCRPGGGNLARDSGIRGAANDLVLTFRVAKCPPLAHSTLPASTWRRREPQLCAAKHGAYRRNARRSRGSFGGSRGIRGAAAKARAHKWRADLVVKKSGCLQPARRFTPYLQLVCHSEDVWISSCYATRGCLDTVNERLQPA